MAQSSPKREYHKNRPKQILISLALLAVLLVLAIYSLSINSFEVSMQEALDAIINRIKGIEPVGYIAGMIDYVVIDVNSPRTIAAILVGTTLAVSGTVMQTLTHNPLAEPYTIGISSAALFGATLCIALGVSVIPGVGKDIALCANSFIFAMVPALVIVSASSLKKLSPNMMILLGIGMMYVFSASTTFLKFNTSEEKLQEIYIWGVGTLTKIQWEDVIPLLVGCVLLIVVFTAMSRKINVLMAGDKVCQSLGENPNKIRLISFTLISLGVAIVVCYTGTIGFVGLVAPHLTRLFVGNNNRPLIPLSALSGSLLILVSDVVVRSLPGGLPCGVVTALIGSPMFLYFLFKQRKKSTF
ncbi:MAG: iron ABC transporter permease [archaeon]|nr:iron ABC transporter permease [archaeon]